MHAVILCPGPSLARLRRVPPCDVVLAVNRAAHHSPADWWVALDEPSFESLPPWIPPKWLTMDAVRLKAVVPEGVNVETIEEWSVRYPYDVGGAAWTTFTMTAAMVAAMDSGAKSIDLYGYDATDAPDFDGTRHETSNRTADRWTHEAQCFEVVSRWLAARGCHVNRMSL